MMFFVEITEAGTGIKHGISLLHVESVRKHDELSIVRMQSGNEITCTDPYENMTEWLEEIYGEPFYDALQALPVALVAMVRKLALEDPSSGE